MSTIRDVAQHAQVSVTTVSHVVNRTRFVEPATERRVRDAIGALGYRPNLLARGLRKRATQTIGLLVPDNSNPFFAEVARCIEDAGFAEGYSVILCNSDLSEEKQEAYIDVLLAKQVDGLILISSGSRVDPVRRIVDAGVPVVLVDRELGDLPVPQVHVDNEAGGYAAGEYLARLGHRRIACIGGPSDATPSHHRIDGFVRALAEADVTLPPEALVPGDGRYQGGVGAMRELLRRDLGVSAVFAFNDLMAIGAITALRESGLRVPDDVSVIGFDDIAQASASYPALTTIAQPKAEMGRASARMLLDQLAHRGDDTPTRLLLSTDLMVRESCRAVSEPTPEPAWARVGGAGSVEGGDRVFTY